MQRLVLLFALVVVACGGDGSRGVDVLRDDVVLTLGADGSASVVETIQVRASPAAAGDADWAFERVLPSGVADRFTDIQLDLDGAPAGAAGHVAASGSGAAQVSWRHARDGAPHTLTLRYRAVGVLAVTGGRATLRWPTLPPGRAYAIGAARVACTWPDAWAAAGNPGVETAGWQVAWLAHGFTAERAPVEAADAGVVAAELALGGLTLRQPEWQFRAARAAELAPAFLSGGVFILVIGAGIVWMVRFRLSEAGSAADLDRRAVARGFRSGGRVVLVLGVFCVVVAWFALGRYGWAPMAIPLSVGLVGAMFLGAARGWARDGQ